MEKEPRVFGAFCQCALHFAMRFGEVTCRSQRPGKGVVSEDVTARTKFSSRKSKRRPRILVSRREKQRQCPGIATRAVFPKLHFNSRRFVFAGSCAQRLGERPLIFRKRIQLRGVLQSVHGFAEPIVSKQHSSLQQERWRIIVL